MTMRTVRLIDQARAVVAEAEVEEEGDLFGGTIDLSRTPPGPRALFEEFEEVVNGQMFAFLEEVQGKIATLGLRAVFENGSEVPVRDLQVFPSAGDVSFRLPGQTHRSLAR